MVGALALSILTTAPVAAAAAPPVNGSGVVENAAAGQSPSTPGPVEPDVVFAKPHAPKPGVEPGLIEVAALGAALALVLGLLIWQQLQIAAIGAIPRRGKRDTATLAETVLGIDHRLNEVERAVEQLYTSAPARENPVEPLFAPLQPAIPPRRDPPAPLPAPPPAPSASPSLDWASTYAPVQVSGPSLTQIEANYRAALSSRSRQRLNEFMREQAAFGLKLGPVGSQMLRRADGEAEPLLYGIALNADRIAVLPGNDIVLSFATMYGSARAMPPELRAAFEFEIDGSSQFKLVAASQWSEAAPGDYRLIRPGVIGGLSD
jgi:hypothetical protein